MMKYVFLVLTTMPMMVVLGFAPLSSIPPPAFGITTSSTSTPTTRLFLSSFAASSSSSSSSSSDDANSFDGIDLERILGTKKFKKQLKKFQRKSKNRIQAANLAMAKQERQSMHTSLSATTTTTTTTTSSSDDSNADAVPKGLKLLICGAPAAGKGTQCAFIKEKFGVVHLSTGDMLRAAVAAQTDVGTQAKEFMDAGKLVPDEVMIGIIKDRLKSDDCQSNGWLLDGFPRTQAQAQALADDGITGDCFIMLNVPDEDLIDRVVGRRTDPETGDIYHLTFSPPTDPDVMARLQQRSDDTEEKVKVRLEQYHANVEAVKGSYTDIIVEINGVGKPTDVFSQIEAAIASKVSATTA